MRRRKNERLWELINPSDPYTFVAERYDVAFAATALLNSLYGAQEIGHNGKGYVYGQGESVPPIAFLDSEKGVALLTKTFGASLDHWMENPDNRLALAQCWESFLIGNATDREACMVGLEAIQGTRDAQSVKDEAKAKYLAERHNRMRSSTNDIGALVASHAKKTIQSLDLTVEQLRAQVDKASGWRRT